MKIRTPKYRKKTVKSAAGKTKVYAVMTYNGKDKILGRYNSKESKRLYRRLLAEVHAEQTEAAETEISVLEIAIDYAKFARSYYRKDGKLTSEWFSVQVAMKTLRELYGDTPASEFGPRRFKVIRQTLMDRGLSRTTINHYSVHIVRAFRMATADEKIPARVFQGMRAVEPLRAGRTNASEPRKIAPVKPEIFDAVSERVPAIVKTMMKLQALTGMRPAEVCDLRPCDVDRSGDTWIYSPRTHKTEHHGRKRFIVIGPEGQKILRPFLLRDATSYCFNPAETVEQKRRQATLNRVTPMSCGNRPGSNRKRKPKRQAGNKYTTDSYRRAITRGCDKAFPVAEDMTPEQVKAHRKRFRFAPNQIRKLAATQIRKECSLEAAQLILGHANKSTTEKYYAELPIQEAVRVIRKLG